MRQSQGVGVPVEKGHLFQRCRGKRPNFEGKGRKKTILGNREHKKIRLGEQGNKPNYFRGTREQVPPFQGSVGHKKQILGVIRAKSDGYDESARLSLALAFVTESKPHVLAQMSVLYYFTSKGGRLWRVCTFAWSCLGLRHNGD